MKKNVNISFSGQNVYFNLIRSAKSRCIVKEQFNVNNKKSPARLCVGDDVLNQDSLNSKAKRAKFLSHILQGTSESNKLIRSKLRCLSVD